MILEINLNSKPYSVNRYYYGNRAIKRREAVQWEQVIIENLRDEEVQKNIEEFMSHFDPKENCFSVELTFYYPESLFYTKKGMLSTKVFDITNVEKPLVDTVFLEKYSTSVIKNLQIDDKYITKCVSQKLPSESHWINVKIQLESL